MSDPALPAAFRVRIGDWWLEPATHRLHRGNQQKRLTRLQVRLLLALAERADHSWTRQQLIERVWPRRMVADEVLSRAIAQLRILLEDDARQPRYIETLHGTGYRLLVGVANGEPENAVETLPPEPPAREAAVQQDGSALTLWRWLAPAALVAGLLLAYFGLRPAAPAAEPSWSQRIATAQSYMSTGSVLRQPRFALDGQRLLWIEPTEQRLRVADRSGRVLHSFDLAPATIGSAVFARDGRSIYALLQNESCRLVEIPLLLPRAEPIELSACLHASLGLAIEADGSLVFTAADRGLLRHPRTGAAERGLTAPDCAGCVDSQPRAAAAGTAFLRGHGGQDAIWLRAPDGQTRRLSKGDDRITDLAWETGNKALIAASNAWGSPALVRIDLAGATPQLLGARGAYGLDLAADGALAFEQRQVQSPLWLHSAEGSPRRLTQSLRDDSQPALSPDGRRIAFVSNRSGSGGIWLLDLESGRETQLSLPEARAWTRPSWSADGQRLWLSRYDDTGVQAAQVEAATGRVLPAPGELESELTERVLERAQGEWLLLVQRGSTRVLIAQRGSVSFEIAGSQGVGSFASDGDWVVFQRAEDSQLWAWRWGQSAQPARALSVESPTSWTVHDGELWHYRPERHGSLLRTRLEDASTRRWADDFGAAPRDLQVVNGGKALLFSRVLRVDSELMLSLPAR